ncbi:MAG: hypothetical protein QW796_07180 [Thermoproteota archaeon]
MTRQAKLGDFRKKEIYEATEDKEVQGPYELPEGWRWVKLEDVCWINREVMDPRKKIPDKEFVYIDISGVEGGIGQILNVKKILGKDASTSIGVGLTRASAANAARLAVFSFKASSSDFASL